MEPGYRILDHPADLGIEAWGPTFGEAISMAVSGLASVLVDPATVESKEQKPLSVSATDSEALVVKVLSDVLFLFDAELFVPANLIVKAESATTLEGFVKGEPLREGKHRMRTDVKAITYHQVSVRQEPSGVFVTVYLDI